MAVPKHPWPTTLFLAKRTLILFTTRVRPAPGWIMHWLRLSFPGSIQLSQLESFSLLLLYPSLPTNPPPWSPARGGNIVLWSMKSSWVLWLALVDRILAGIMQTGDFNALTWFDSMFAAASMHHERNMLCRNAGPDGKSRGADVTPTHSLKLSLSMDKWDCLLHDIFTVRSKWQKLKSPSQQRDQGYSQVLGILKQQ